MKNKKLEKIIIIVTSVFIIITLFLMFGGNLFENRSNARKENSTLMPEATDITAEIKAKTVVEQEFVNTTDTISSLGIVFSRYVYLEGVHITIELRDGNNVIASRTVNVADIEDQHRTFVEPTSVLTGMKGKNLTLRIYSADKEDTGMKIMMSENSDSTFKFGNVSVKGTLCFSITE